MILGGEQSQFDMGQMNRPPEEIEKMVEQSFREEVKKQKEKGGFKWFWESDSSDDEEEKKAHKNKGFFSKMMSNYEKNIGEGKKKPLILVPTSQELEKLNL